MHPKDRPGAELLSALRDHFSTDQFVGEHDIQDVLDAVFGADWQVEHITLNGAICCRLGVRIDGEWRWRSNGGEDYAQAFRHAAEMWGIGRLPSAAAEARADEDEEGDAPPVVDVDRPLRIVRAPVESGGVAHQPAAKVPVGKSDSQAPQSDWEATPADQMVSESSNSNPPIVDELPWGEPDSDMTDESDPDSNAICNDLCKEFQSVSNAHMMPAKECVHVMHLQARYHSMKEEHRFLVSHAVCRHLIDILSFLKPENHDAMARFAVYRDLLVPFLGEAKLKFEIEQNKARARLSQARRPNARRVTTKESRA